MYFYLLMNKDFIIIIINLMTSIFRLRFNNLAPFEKTGFVTSWSKECHVMLGMNFPKLFY